MNILDTQSIININSTYDELNRCTKFTIQYHSWDAHGVPMIHTSIFSLTQTAQDEIIEGVEKLLKSLKSSL